MRALGFLLVLLIAFVGADASTEIENAISPNKKLILTMKPAGEFNYKVFLKDRVNGKVFTSFNVEDFFADDVRDTMTAHWRNDSAVVALIVDKGRNISECEVIVLA